MELISGSASIEKQLVISHESSLRGEDGEGRCMRGQKERKAREQSGLLPHGDMGQRKPFLGLAGQFGGCVHLPDHLV